MAFFIRPNSKVSSTSLNKKVESTMTLFKSMAESLSKVSEDALTEKAATEEYIQNLQKETGNLETISQRALKMAEKLTSFFD